MVGFLEFRGGCGLRNFNHKDHKGAQRWAWFLVFVVCVCFVVEQGSERRREVGVSEAALLKKLCVSAALREVFFRLTVDGLLPWDLVLSQKIDQREWHEEHR